MSLTDGQADGAMADAALLAGEGNAHAAASPAAGVPSADVAIGSMSSFEFWLSVILLVFGLLVVGGQLWLATRRGEGDAPAVSIENGIRLSTVTLIIVGALVLIASGYSNNQIAPAMGLFGTIAGYLIGKQDRA